MYRADASDPSVQRRQHHDERRDVMSFLVRTLVKAIYAAVLGGALLGWLGAAAGAIEHQSQPAPIAGV